MVTLPLPPPLPPRPRTNMPAQIPMDIVNCIQHYVERPGVGIFCRRGDRSEAIVYHSLDGQTTQHVRKISEPRRYLYGYPAVHTWGSPAVVTARMVPTADVTAATLTNIDFSTGAESRPAWLDRVAPTLFPVMPSATVALDEHHLMVPRADFSFAVVDTQTGAVVPTSLTFGARNPGLGRAFLAARNYCSQGSALISGSCGDMWYYSGRTDTATQIGRYGQTPCRQITCLQSVPNTETFVVGYAQRALLYDFRAGYAPVLVAADAPHPLWTSAAMFTEHALVSWNSLTADARGFHIQSHCQFIDLRAPQEWHALPAWKLPGDVAPHWALPLRAVPEFPAVASRL